MQKLLLAFGLAGCGGAALADIIETPGAALMSCNYTVECLDEEACTFAQFGHDVDLPKQMPGEADLVLGTGPATGTAQVVNGVLVIFAHDGNGSYLLSQTPDGLAKLSVQFADPLTVVTYHGECVVTG
ncbi:hypothetical protein PVW46_06400 [Mameliella sp. AT18]|uniref:hypothetical protein n=1 Tax=Mameliella TaxID=1434019 RepID=UPI00084114F1|nr:MULTISPECIES: hypothetical protein [Mameliella]MDD9729535.1 hypothetical protein [Mameliella sp. AT18]ODM49923.1 hypothetical protein A9320_12900 [Ruegeria sp. PBVC088]